ncbi:unnamed protein product [Cercospora beticola]|nr:unnamed protein product [Cercospora beticola]
MAHSTVSRLLPQSAAQVLLTVVVLVIGYQVTIYIYNIFLHPLRKFPGPLTSAASNWPKIRASTRGDGVFRVVDLHHKYGEVVRTGPNELSFSGNAAYKDIYGHKKAGQRTLVKDPKFYGNPSGEYDIVNGNDEQHARMRRVFTHAFSDKALKRQEPLFLLYVDKLVAKSKELSAKEPERKFNMVQMYNFTTFDIMGDLTFGESLNMLEDTDYHPWVAAMLPAFRFAVYVHVIRCFPLLELFMLKYCISKSTIETMKTHKKFCVDRVDRRLEQKDARPDIWGMVMETEGSVDAGLTKQEQYSNANLFMIAGTETTATILSGITYYLLTNPSKMSRLIEETRSKIRNEDEIGIERLQGLPYLNAVIEEGLRMYPSISYCLARKTPPGAPTFIDGREVPAGYQPI